LQHSKNTFRKVKFETTGSAAGCGPGCSAGFGIPRNWLCNLPCSWLCTRVDRRRRREVHSKGLHKQLQRQLRSKPQRIKDAVGNGPSREPSWLCSLCSLSSGCADIRPAYPRCPHPHNHIIYAVSNSTI